jgi:hypothetical protein
MLLQAGDASPVKLSTADLPIETTHPARHCLVSQQDSASTHFSDVRIVEGNHFLSLLQRRPRLNLGMAPYPGEEIMVQIIFSLEL